MITKGLINDIKDILKECKYYNSDITFVGIFLLIIRIMLIPLTIFLDIISFIPEVIIYLIWRKL